MGTSVRAMFSASNTVTLDLRGVTEFVEVSGRTPSGRVAQVHRATA